LSREDWRGCPSGNELMRPQSQISCLHAASIARYPIN
jgi:hypothetical protein